jgi:hypothetical protein
MGAAEDKEPELTPQERAELRRLLRLLRRGASGSVDETAPKSVRPTRRPPDAAYEKVDRLRKRKGIRDGS